MNADALSGSTRASAEFAGVSMTIALARNLVDEFLERRAASQDLRERAALAVSELASNAVQASPDHTYVVAVEEDAQSGELVIAVTNGASIESIPPNERWGPADILAPRGRGLAILEAISDRVDIEPAGTGAVVVTARLSAP